MTDEIHKIYKDVEDIKHVVHKLEVTKQDKVRPWVFIPIVLYLVAQSFAAIWWASNVSTTMKTLTVAVEAAGRDRFTGKDGDSLARYMEFRMLGVEEKVRIVDDRLVEHRKDTSLCRERIKANEQSVLEIKSRLLKLEDKGG